MAGKPATNEPFNGKASCANGKTCLNLDVFDYQARLPEVSCLCPTVRCWKTISGSANQDSSTPMTATGSTGSL
jgi:hypothetical protein